MKPKIFSVFLEKKTIILCIFPEKKNNQNKICVPTLPKMFRPVTRDTLVVFLSLKIIFIQTQLKVIKLCLLVLLCYIDQSEGDVQAPCF